MKLLECFKEIGYCIGECVEKVWNFTMMVLAIIVLLIFWAAVAYLAWSFFQ